MIRRTTETPAITPPSADPSLGPGGKQVRPLFASTGRPSAPPATGPSARPAADGPAGPSRPAPVPFHETLRESRAKTAASAERPPAHAAAERDPWADTALQAAELPLPVGARLQVAQQAYRRELASAAADEPGELLDTRI